ncbi:MAG TPA: hypothetical protein VG474_06530 [Solirubrobacteraceae bacterium]|nr:hypothetical protein [Solirubrobacteraceae bacterium]
MSALDASLTVLAATVPDAGAGGASTRDLMIAGGIAGFAIIVLLMGGLGHRAGLIPTLGWFERFSERVSGQPAWASLPCGLAIISLISAVFGLYWDVSLHIDRGRDTSVWGNPGHLFILGGLYGIFAAGFFAICLGREERADRPGPTAIRIAGDWYAPLGGVLMCATGLFSLVAFPLDDFWHRLFGQDVTLWGPTHLMLIGGAVMTLVAIAVIQVEVVRAMKSAGVAHLELGWVRHLRQVWLPGGLLVGMSTFQGEFDFGVPQFQQVFHPMLIMLAAGLTLVATRIWLGRGALLGAIVFYIVMRGGLALLVHDALGQSLPHFPLYIAEALCVEAAALLVSPRRPIAFGATAGALIGTIGLAAEWGWSHVWMPLPWAVEILPEAIVLGLAMALAASLLGAWLGARLHSDELPRIPALRPVALTAAIAIFALLALPLFTDGTSDVRASVTLSEVRGGPARAVNATIALQPRDAAEGAIWLTATAWQGGGLIVDRLRRVSDGVYRTTRPIPVHGSWKAMIRMHKPNSLVALPIYAPRDTAIPVAAIPAPTRFERAFRSDRELLQREARTRESAITNGAYGIVLALALGLIALLAWAVHRVGATAGAARHTPPPEWARPEPEPEPPPAPQDELPEWARRRPDPVAPDGDAAERAERQPEHAQ